MRLQSSTSYAISVINTPLKTDTAELPERVIDKGIPGAGLLAMILTGKYCDHLPLYRQKQIFARENIQNASSTIEGWTKEALIKLAIV